jgi:hypothetical protein
MAMSSLRQAQRNAWLAMMVTCILLAILMACIGRWEAHTYLAKTFSVIFSCGFCVAALASYFLSTNYRAPKS